MSVRSLSPIPLFRGKIVKTKIKDSVKVTFSWIRSNEDWNTDLQDRGISSALAYVSTVNLQGNAHEMLPYYPNTN